MKASNVVLAIGAAMIIAEMVFDNQFSGGQDYSVENNKVALAGLGLVGVSVYMKKKGK